MRIPIKALRELAKQYDLAHVIVFAHDATDKDGEPLHHIATYGRTRVECSEAADFGNTLKKALGWPESLQAQPARVRKIEQELNKAQEEVKKLKKLIPMDKAWLEDATAAAQGQFSDRMGCSEVSMGCLVEKPVCCICGEQVCDHLNPPNANKIEADSALDSRKEPTLKEELV